MQPESSGRSRSHRRLTPRIWGPQQALRPPGRPEHPRHEPALFPHDPQLGAQHTRGWPMCADVLLMMPWAHGWLRHEKLQAAAICAVWCIPRQRQGRQSCAVSQPCGLHARVYLQVQVDRKVLNHPRRRIWHALHCSSRGAMAAWTGPPKLRRGFRIMRTSVLHRRLATLVFFSWLFRVVEGGHPGGDHLAPLPKSCSFDQWVCGRTCKESTCHDKCEVCRCPCSRAHMILRKSALRDAVGSATSLSVDSASSASCPGRAANASAHSC